MSARTRAVRPARALSPGRRPPRVRLWRVLLLLAIVLVVLLGGGGLLMFTMPGRSHEGELPPLTAGQILLRETLRRDLKVLASDIGARNVYQPERLARAEAFLVETLTTRGGYAVRRHPFTVRDGTVANLDVEIEGADSKAQIVVVGAHYDTVPACPGANDNGTGVVATLALAEAFAGTKPKRTLRFVCFVNEEPPFFQTGDMGSVVYANACRERGEDVVAMLSLETIGYYVDTEGSQRYPFPVGFVYPDTGNFISFVGNLGSRKLVREVVESFRRHAAFPSEGAAVPGWVTGVGWSDHWAFWKAGYPGVMVTDTALFRYAEYHTSKDTVDRIHYDGFARVVDGLRHVVADLAGVTLPVEGGDG